MPSKFPCLGQKKLKYNATYLCSNGFLNLLLNCALTSYKEGNIVEEGLKVGRGAGCTTEIGS